LTALLAAREHARKHKDWSTADTIRKTLEEHGFEIQDTAQGPVWRKK
jgi:cysteinyl-tRNA synthetase